MFNAACVQLVRWTLTHGLGGRQIFWLSRSNRFGWFTTAAVVESGLENRQKRRYGKRRIRVPDGQLLALIGNASAERRLLHFQLNRNNTIKRWRKCPSFSTGCGTIHATSGLTISRRSLTSTPSDTGSKEPATWSLSTSRLDYYLCRALVQSSRFTSGSSLRSSAGWRVWNERDFAIGGLPLHHSSPSQ